MGCCTGGFFIYFYYSKCGKKTKKDRKSHQIIVPVEGQHHQIIVPVEGQRHRIHGATKLVPVSHANSGKLEQHNRIRCATGVVPISHANSDKRQQHHHIRGATKVVPISHANSEKPEKLVAATKLIGHGLDADQIPNTRGKLTGKSRSSLNLLGQPIQEKQQGKMGTDDGIEKSGKEALQQRLAGLLTKQQGKKGTDDSIENSGKEVLQQRLAGLLTNYKKIDSNNQGQGQGTDQDGDQD